MGGLTQKASRSGDNVQVNSTQQLNQSSLTQTHQEDKEMTIEEQHEIKSTGPQDDEEYQHFNYDDIEDVNSTINIKVKTWTRDSHGLFDHESKNKVEQEVTTQSSGRILRDGNTVTFSDATYGLSNMGYEGQTLFNVERDTEGFYIQNYDNVQDEEESAYKMWTVCKGDYKLKKFDTIKLGRVRFMIKGLKYEGQQMTPEELCKQDNIEAVEVKRSDQIDNIQECSEQDIRCRFCFESTDTDEDPLILCCKCKGSVGLIHYQCLKQWLMFQKQEKVESSNIKSYFWKKFQCEICHHKYPFSFKTGNRVYKLVDFINEIINNTTNNHILLESLPIEKKANATRCIHLLTVTPGTSEFKIGRGHSSQVRIQDISVSRVHAILKHQQDGFYIQDNTSKFGSTILIKDKFRINSNTTPTQIQVGRSILDISENIIPQQMAPENVVE